MSVESRDEPRRRRSPRNVSAAAKILRKEARKILRRHTGRLSPAVVEQIRAALAAMDAHREARDWEKLEDAAEEVDELLHQHASFARKSAWRETVENILVAVLVALGLRSCLYEPFKIPSGSMMPTLYAGDHIFVNKFTYGIQVPFTTTVVGESFGDIQRGDVVVFRYPLDESEDFIKRVVGVAGDEIRLDGHDLWIKRAGDQEFQEVPRERVDAQCVDETGTELAGECTVYEETLDGRTYMVRYMANAIERAHLARDDRVWKVPAGHYFVMGDNRSQSHDSSAWTITVEAVSAESLLSIKDLRDLTSGDIFTTSHPEKDIEDPHYDHVLYLGDHRAPEHDLELEVWRSPTLGAEVVFESRAEMLEDAERTTLAALLADARELKPHRLKRLERLSGRIDDLVVGASEEGFDAIVLLESAQAVIQLHCGRSACAARSKLASRIASAVTRFDRDHSQDAREILQGDRAHRYGRSWTARGDPGEHFVDRTFAREGGEGERGRVRLRAWRHPDQEVVWLRNAALRSVGTSPAQAEELLELGRDAWLTSSPGQIASVVVDEKRRIVVLLECGRDRCSTTEDALRLVRNVAARMPHADGDRGAFADLLRQTDVPGWTDESATLPELASYDRVTLEGTARDSEHSVDLRVWLRPADGLEAKVAALAAGAQGLQPDDRVRVGGRSGDDDGFVHLFGVSQSSAVVQLRCGRGLCPSMEASVQLAQRVADKAMDETSFVDPAAVRSSPFVPRGHVKGRAERIWLPLERFWLPVR